MIVGDNPSRSFGFTLIELLVTIGVIAIMATIALPSFQGLIARSRLSSDFNEILSSLNYARSEAVKRREDIMVDVNVIDGSWQVVVNDSASSALRTLDSRDDRVSVTPVDFSVTFNPLGRRSPTSGCGSTCTLTVAYQSSESLSVNKSGNISRP